MRTLIYTTSRMLTWFGSLLLLALAVMSVFSITGRALSGFGFAPVKGDFELMAMGCAVVIFCYMPWCHLKRGHADVPLLWNAYPAWLKTALMMMVDLITLLLWMVLVWRMGIATVDYYHNDEATFILQIHVWWGYAMAMIPAVFGCVVYAWRCLETLGWVEPPGDFVFAEGGH